MKKVTRILALALSVVMCLFKGIGSHWTVELDGEQVCIK